MPELRASFDSSKIETVTVTLSRGVSYPIYIGTDAIHLCGNALKVINPKQKNVVVITEERVASFYRQQVETLLSESGVKTEFLILQSGEGTKNFTNLEKVTRFCLEKNVERNHAIIALGGGVIGDLVGFAASMIRRGCKFIQIPTTLLAQTDSAVGGKTAINTPEGKNLVGAFYQPDAVIADTAYLKTLPERDYAAGFAEVVKYGLLGDREFFIFLENNLDAYRNRELAFLTHIVKHCAQMKADIVARDETERGDRALLNLGHTFGHAYEAETGYSDRLLHGEAVAIGCVNAFDFSEKIGDCTKPDAQRVKDFFRAAGLPVSARDIIPDYDAEKLLARMQQDKKNSDGELTFILTRGIGKAYIQKATSAREIFDFLQHH